VKFTVFGRVHPENASVWLDRIESPTCAGGRFSIECKVSQILVIWEDPNVTDLDSAQIAATNLAQTYISAVGFAVGANYAVEILLVRREDGQLQRKDTKNPALDFGEASKTVLPECMSLAGSDPHFRFALIDYCKAIMNPIETGFHCFRAIEAIKCAFDPKDWNKMHAALGTTRAQIDSIVKVNADPIRHGNWSEIPITTKAERDGALLLTRDILYKHLKYRQSASRK